MSLGSYPSGATVRIPLQITEGHIPILVGVDMVQIEKIYKPDLSLDSSFPASMTLLNEESALYYFDYKPSSLGNYIVILTFEVSSVKYSVIEHFSVQEASVSTGSSAKPRGSAVIEFTPNPSAEAL